MSKSRRIPQDARKYSDDGRQTDSNVRQITTTLTDKNHDETTKTMVDVFAQKKQNELETDFSAKKRSKPTVNEK